MALGAWLAWATWMPVSPPTQKSVLLRPGYSTRRIATELKSSGVIRSADAFVLWHYLHHKGSLKAGEYQFDKAANVIDIHKRLVRGDIYVHTVVMPEGYTIFDIAQTVQASGLGSREGVLRAAQANVGLISDFAAAAYTAARCTTPTSVFHLPTTRTRMPVCRLARLAILGRVPWKQPSIPRTLTTSIL